MAAPAATPSRGQANPRRGVSVSSRWGWASAIEKKIGGMTPRSRWIAIAAVMAVMVSPRVEPHAQTRRPMTLIDIAELSRILNPQLSPDGRTLVYHRSRADWKAGAATWHLWRQDIGGAPTQMTFAESGEIAAPGSLRWSPDGKTLSFLRAGQIYLMSADGGEPRALTKHATSVTATIPPAWTPDSAAIYFVAPDQRTADERERDRVRDDVFAFDEELSAAAPLESRRLDRHRDADHVGRSISPRVPLVGRREVNRVAPRAVARCRATRIAAKCGRWTRPARTRACSRTTPSRKAALNCLRTRARCCSWPTRTSGSIRTTTPICSWCRRPAALLGSCVPDFNKYAFEQATWAADGRSILAVVNMGVHNEVFRIDVPSRKVQAADRRQALHHRSGRRLEHRPGRREDGAAARRTDKVRRRLDHAGRRRSQFADARDECLRHARARLHPAAAGKSRVGEPGRHRDRGPALLPAGLRAGQAVSRSSCRCTAGRWNPTSSARARGVLQNYFPVLTAQGYAVLRPNYRGSAGYGNTVYRDIVGHYFQNMQLDVMSGVDALIQRGIADPDRLVVMGWSAGGHLTNKLITMTDRFKAASSGAGVADWISMYAQTDTRASRTVWFGGTPWQKDAPFDDVLGQFAAQGRGEREDADAVLRRRERRSRPDAAVGRDVSRAEEPTACRRSSSSRRAKVISGASCAT